MSKTSQNLALPVGMKGFQQLAVAIGPNVPLCVRGRHAVGKSEGVHQAAEKIFSDFYKNHDNCLAVTEALRGERAIRDRLKECDTAVWKYEMGIPVVERRLSQMTEGDIIGLPFESASGQSTQFKPVDWLINSCKFPVMLFLDERNRALPGVKQAVFQLLDSKAFYGHVLHDETRTIVAENTGGSYEVNQTDPAEVSRAATIELVPNTEEWIEYAKIKCNPALVDYIRHNPNDLEWRDEFEENKKYPDRRSWVKLDGLLTDNKCYDNPRDHLFYLIAGSMVGVEIASKFKTFCTEYKTKVVGAEDVLNDWEKAKEHLIKNAGMKVVPNDKYMQLGEKIGDYLKTKKINDEQGINITLFMIDAPPEIRMAFNSAANKIPNNIVILNRYARQVIVASTNLTNSNLDGLRAKLTQDLKDLRAKNGTTATPEASGPEATKKRGATR